MEAFEVGRGEYEDYAVLAVFVDRDDAQRYADWWNLNHLGEAGRVGAAHIAGTISVYGPGEWKPPSVEVIEGSVIDREQVARALPFRETPFRED